MEHLSSVQLSKLVDKSYQRYAYHQRVLKKLKPKRGKKSLAAMEARRVKAKNVHELRQNLVSTGVKLRGLLLLL